MQAYVRLATSCRHTQGTDLTIANSETTSQLVKSVLYIVIARI